MKKNVIIFDKQHITSIGMETLIKRHGQAHNISYVDRKDELITRLIVHDDSLVVLDYTLSDLNSADGLLNISARFPKTHWLLFSEDLSIAFIKKVILSNDVFSVVLKAAGFKDINSAISKSFNNEKFICSLVTNRLLMFNVDETHAHQILTITEQEILKEIALGKTAKEIAANRNVSVHTIITHRKNIYRKLDVNNSQEASGYALRAGLIDASDYYI